LAKFLTFRHDSPLQNPNQPSVNVATPAP